MRGHYNIINLVITMASEKKKVTNLEKFWKKHFPGKTRVPREELVKALKGFFDNKKRKAWKDKETPFVNDEQFLKLLTERIFWTEPTKEDQKDDKVPEFSGNVSFEAVEMALDVFYPWPGIFSNISQDLFEVTSRPIDFFHGCRDKEKITKRLSDAKTNKYLLRYSDNKKNLLLCHSKQTKTGNTIIIEEEIFRKNYKDNDNPWHWNKKEAQIGKAVVKKVSEKTFSDLISAIMDEHGLDPKNKVMFKSAYDVPSVGEK